MAASDKVACRGSASKGRGSRVSGMTGARRSSALLLLV